MSWNFHIEEIITKLNKDCFAIRSVRPYLSYEVLRMTYFSYFHSIMSYGIVFWDNSSQNNSIVKNQKRTISVFVNSSSRTSCRELFKELQILSFHSQYMYSLLMFVVKNRYLLKSNSDVHYLSTSTSTSDLQLPTSYRSLPKWCLLLGN
jgi:hypothetical protein